MVLRRILTAIACVLLAAAAGEAAAEVVCGVRINGRFRCTYFCQNGFICDNANMRCLPGPEIKKNLSDLQEKAKQAALKANRGSVTSQAETRGKMMGHDLGSTYYIWNGDPREIPTPRHRQGGFIPATSASRTISYARPGRTILAAARSMSASDPNRAGAIKLLRDFAHKNKLAIDVDELLECDTKKFDDLDKGNAFRLRWDVPAVDAEARKRCADSTADEAREQCVAYQFGQVVMWAEPELKALCKLQENDFQEKDPAELGECAERKFRNALANRQGWVPLTSKGRGLAASRSCPELSDDALDDLRKKLKEALSSADPGGGGEPGPNTASAAPPPPSAQPDPPTAENPSDDDEDPFCAFIARKAVRGELTPGGGASIPDYCRKAVDAAKSCEEQKCSMADIIDEAERKNARRMPWGVEDYQGVAQLAGSGGRP